MQPNEEELIEHYMPLVRRLALQLAARLPASIELDDLMQAGLMGLLDAVRRYQASADAQFETYATTRIRGAMLDDLRSQDWLPRSVRSKARQIEQVIHTLQQHLLRPPTESEIAQAMSLPLREYQQFLEDAQGSQVIHYEDMLRSSGQGGDVHFAAVSVESADTEGPAQSGNPLDHLMSVHLRQALMCAINDLPEREKLVLALQFEQDLNQKEIAAVLQVTEGRVSQLRSQAVARIRATLAKGQWGSVHDHQLLRAVL